MIDDRKQGIVFVSFQFGFLCDRIVMWHRWSCRRQFYFLQRPNISDERLDLVVAQLAAERFHRRLAVFLYAFLDRLVALASVKAA